MGRRRQPEEKKPAGAPAYMTQYTALMTILLAFFIVMLTLGQDRVAQYKVGVGLIQDMFSMKGGGMGVLPFWRSLTRGVPDVPADVEDAPDAALLGYYDDSISSINLAISGMRNVLLEDMNNTFRFKAPLGYDEDQIRVSSAYSSALEHVAAVLYALDGYQITVCVVVKGDDKQANRVLAARRAAWLMRYLIEFGRLNPVRVRSAGYGDARYLNGDNSHGEVFFMLRPLKNTTSSNV